MNPHDNNNLFYKLTAGDKDSPGKIVAITDCDREWVWDEKKPTKQEGVDAILHGVKRGIVAVTFWLWKDYDTNIDHFELWDAFQDQLESFNSGPEARAFEVYHPVLSRQGYTELRLKKIYGQQFLPTGEALVRVDFSQHLPPREKKPVKVAASQVSPISKKVDPNAAAKAELAALVKEAQEP